MSNSFHSEMPALYRTLVFDEVPNHMNVLNSSRNVRYRIRNKATFMSWVNERYGISPEIIAVNDQLTVVTGIHEQYFFRPSLEQSTVSSILTRLAQTSEACTRVLHVIPLNLCSERRKEECLGWMNRLARLTLSHSNLERKKDFGSN